MYTRTYTYMLNVNGKEKRKKNNGKMDAKGQGEKGKKTTCVVPGKIIDSPEKKMLFCEGSGQQRVTPKTWTLLA